MVVTRTCVIADKSPFRRRHNLARASRSHWFDVSRWTGERYTWYSRTATARRVHTSRSRQMQKRALTTVSSRFCFLHGLCSRVHSVCRCLSVGWCRRASYCFVDSRFGWRTIRKPQNERGECVWKHCFRVVSETSNDY